MPVIPGIKQARHERTGRGTWLHPKLSVAFARWCDPEILRMVRPAH
ncbi:KilA-N domain-containing protein [Escherichia coli]|nr:KilA-N domain-containing protein [Escherichia coli]